MNNIKLEFPIKCSIKCVNEPEKAIRCPNCAQASRLLSSVRLSAVLKVRIGTTGAVHANITGGGDVGAPMRLRHHGHDGDARGGPDRLGPELGEKRFSTAVSMLQLGFVKV
ncbi:hypothetical protein ACFX1X_039238 [Malus domestica]